MSDKTIQFGHNEPPSAWIEAHWRSIFEGGMVRTWHEDGELRFEYVPPEELLMAPDDDQ